MRISTIRPVIKVIFLVGIMIIMMSVLLKTSKELFKAKSSLWWDRIDGQIVYSQTKRGCGKTGSSFYPDIKYEYKAPNGVTQTASRLMFGDNVCGSEFEAAQFVQKFPVDAKIKIRINPDNMFETVVFPGKFGFGQWAVLITSGFFIFVGFMAAWSQIRTRPERSR